MGIAAEDQVFEKNDARVLLDPQSFLHLNGTELDYKDELGCGQKI
jgi:Fe-S cluster assembly iron-binding protein IscA